MSHRARPARGAAVHRGPSGAPLRLVSVWSVCPRHAFRPGLHVLVTADHRRSPFASTLPVACTMQVVWVEHQGGMNRVNGNPARHARALYSPVPTLATSLAPEENLFGLMGSLAFEQRARPTDGLIFFRQRFSLFRHRMHFFATTDFLPSFSQ